ncbi:MAG: hypothetical protein QMD09_05660 [Desulfatibacillaceae bacterium]|nr:hypothetical protein [Desulfatibacillaceae bacterium]
MHDDKKADSPCRESKGHGVPESASSPLMSEQVFRSRLAALCKGPIQVDFTFNRASLLRASLVRGVIKIRIQHAFRAADDNTLKALADFVQKPESSSQAILKGFVQSRSELICFFAEKAQSGQCAQVEYVPEKLLNGRELKPQGRHKNLEKVLAKVADDYRLDAKGIGIFWSQGREIAGPKRRSIRFGSFNSKNRTIRIHPVLDSPVVPDFFIEFIVYHELLHAIFPPTKKPQERRSIHTGQFKQRERLFARYDEAIAFERKFAREKLGMKIK